MRRDLLLLIVPVMLVPACTNGQKGEAPPAAVEQARVNDGVVEPARFASLMKDRPGQLVDVRTPGEWSEGIITGARLMDFNGSEFRSELSSLDKDRPVYVYCAAGGRSHKAYEMMKEMGFKEVYDLDGGMGAWRNAGREVAPASSATKE
jgi:rhodanese-related sulfurtransferase